MATKTIAQALAEGDAMSLAGRIKIGMAIQGISSVSALAALLNLNRQTVHKWLSGEVDTLDPENLFKLADALQVAPRWLAMKDGDPQPPERVTPELRQLIAIYNEMDESDRGVWQKTGAAMLEGRGKTSPEQPFKVKQR